MATEVRGGRPAATTAAEREPALAEEVRTVGLQESVLIVLNLAVLAVLALVHVLFRPLVGTPPQLFFVVVFGRILMQWVELIWLHTPRGPQTLPALLAYSRTSIWVNLAFAFVISRLGGMEDSHYAVLIVIPVIAAAFRYQPRGVALVLGVAVAMTFVEIWLYFRAHPATSAVEYFEASNVVLIYVVVALVVALLARLLRREGQALRSSLSELARTRDRLVEEEKLAAVGRLSSAIAHEVRNPVAMIVSSLSLADGPGRSAEERREMVSVARREAHRLEHPTTDLLAYARRKPPERRITSMCTTVGYLAGLVQARAEESGVRLETSCPGDLMSMMDPFQIHQAVLNLLVNAIDATPRGGRVELGARADGDGVTVWVANDGEAIADDVVSRIFEPFFTTRPTGTGLGLAIARTIAEAHGGATVLAANRPGAVRFELRLPGSRERAPEGEAPWHAS